MALRYKNQKLEYAYVGLPPELCDKIDKRSSDFGMSRSAVIRTILENHFNKIERIKKEFKDAHYNERLARIG